MLNPWFIGLEAVQRGWQAQSALAFGLMRSFAGGASSPLVPDTVAVDIKAQEEVAAIADAREAPAASTDGKEAPAAIVDVRRRKAPKVLRVAKETSSRMKARSVSKRAASSSGQEKSAAIADVRRSKAPKVLRVSKGSSRVRVRSLSKRAAAARQNSALKAVRRSARKPR
jgi:hypothetical protein